MVIWESCSKVCQGFWINYLFDLIFVRFLSCLGQSCFGFTTLAWQRIQRLNVILGGAFDIIFAYFRGDLGIYKDLSLINKLLTILQIINYKSNNSKKIIT